MIELTMQVSDFDYTETLDNFLPDLIRILSEGEDVNPLIRKAVGASPELSKKIVKGVLPYLIINIAIVVFCCFCPPTTQWLVHLIYG